MVRSISVRHVRREEFSSLPGGEVSQEDSGHDRQKHPLRRVGRMVLHVDEFPAVSVAAESVDILSASRTGDIDWMCVREGQSEGDCE